MLSLWPGFCLCCCLSALLSCQKIRRQISSHLRVPQKIIKLQQDGAVMSSSGEVYISSSLITHTHHPIQSQTIVLMTVRYESVFLLVSCWEWIALQGQIKLSVSVSPQSFFKWLHLQWFSLLSNQTGCWERNMIRDVERFDANLPSSLAANPSARLNKRFGCCDVDSSEVKFGAIHFGPKIAKQKWKFFCLEGE